MNAPWPSSDITAASPNSGNATLAGYGQPSAIGRQSLAGYVGDEASLEVLRACLAGLGWPTDRCQLGALDDAAQALAMTPSPAILILDLSGDPAPLDNIQDLAQVCDPGTMVIALGETNDVQFYRALQASGIHDYLLKPLCPNELAEAILAAQAVLAAPPPAQATPASQHITTAVIGARGGVGATMVATSLAWISSCDLAQPTALLDLDIQFGTGALSLDLDPGSGLVEAIENPSRIDGLFIERAMTRASDTLSLLTAEAPIANSVPTDGIAMLHLAEELRHAFTATVIDLPRTMLASLTPLMTEVTTIVLVTELTLAGARDTIRILDWVKTHAPLARVTLVANKVPSGICEIGPGDFESATERKLDFLLPLEPRLAINAAKQGQSFAQACRGGRMGDTLLAIARAVCASDDATAGTKLRAAPSLLGRLDPRQLLARLSASTPGGGGKMGG